MMTDYEPGTVAVATVRGVLGWWWASEHAHHARTRHGRRRAL